ncbi:MAG: MAPEG family protein [Phenylobacterium sp.]
MDAVVPMELKLLVLAVIIGLVQLIWAAAAATGSGQREIAWQLGPRDEPRPVSGVAARLDRAFKNFLETFPLFAAAVIACGMANKFGGMTLYGCAIYVLARAVFVPVYATGITIVRTLVWTASMVGILMVIVAFFR